MACDTERRQFQMFKIECVEVTVGISVAERLNSKKNKKTPQLIKQDKSCEAENHQQWLCCNMCPEAAAVILLHYASEDGTVFSAAASVTRSVSPSSSSLPPVLCVSQAGMWTRDDKRCSCVNAIYNDLQRIVTLIWNFTFLVTAVLISGTSLTNELQDVKKKRDVICLLAPVCPEPLILVRCLGSLSQKHLWWILIHPTEPHLVLELHTVIGRLSCCSFSSISITAVQQLPICLCHGSSYCTCRTVQYSGFTVGLRGQKVISSFMIIRYSANTPSLTVPLTLGDRNMIYVFSALPSRAHFPFPFLYQWASFIPVSQSCSTVANQLGSQHGRQH